MNQDSKECEESVRLLRNKTFLDSIRCAIRGMGKAFRKEKNFKYYVGIATVFAILNIVKQVENYWWIGYVITTCEVFASELINTAIERLADEVTKEFSLLVGESKDIAASAVLFWGFGLFIIEILALIL